MKLNFVRNYFIHVLLVVEISRLVRHLRILELLFGFFVVTNFNLFRRKFILLFFAVIL